MLLAAGAARAEIKLGVFDFQRVSEETAKGQALQASLSKFRDKKQTEISSRENELKTLRDQYAAQALSLSPDKRSEMEKEMQKKDLDLQTLRDSAQKEMQLEVSEAQQKFQEQLFKVITALGKERGYTVVFERSQAVYFSESSDVTSEIIERFNQDTAKEETSSPKPDVPAGKEAAPAKPPAPSPAPKKPSGK
jgi:outer membrane protein